MSEFMFPGETPEYREQGDRLLDAEVRLRDEIEAVAERRRQLPLGGRLKDNYVFERSGNGGARGGGAAATPAQLRAWAGKRRWTLPLYSDGDSRYLLDYAGFETDDPGLVSVMNVFRKTPEGIFHFWASELLSRPMANGHPRHVDMVWPLWNLLDMTPRGRGDALVPKQDFEHRYFSKEVLSKVQE